MSDRRTTTQIGAVLLVALLAVGGCAQSRNSSRTGAATEAPLPPGDPLFGESRSPIGRPASTDRTRNTGVFGRARAQGQQPPSAELTKRPPPSGNPLLRGPELTNASMAAGLRERRGRESDLRLDGPEGSSRPTRKPEFPPEPIPQQGDAPTRRTSGGIILRAPTESNNPFTGTSMPGRAEDGFSEELAEPTPPSGDDVDSMLDELKRLGALELRLEPTEGGWLCSCAVRSRQNELVQRRYSARDPKKSEAVAMVLRQVRREAGR